MSPFEVIRNAGCSWTCLAFVVFGGDFPVVEKVKN
jgi:hypothetical protein